MDWFLLIRIVALAAAIASLVISVSTVRKLDASARRRADEGERFGVGRLGRRGDAK